VPSLNLKRENISSSSSDVKPMTKRKHVETFYSVALKRWMPIRDWGANRLCKEAGWDPSARQGTISRLRSGKQQTIDFLEWCALCKALRIDPYTIEEAQYFCYPAAMVNVRRVAEDAPKVDE
jgi:DNA-binding Xre family transcriptional regulator